MPDERVTKQLRRIPRPGRVRWRFEFEQRVFVQQWKQYRKFASSGLRKLAILAADQQDVDTQRQDADGHLFLHRVSG